VVLLLLGACFGYGPPGTPSPRPGSRVSLRLWPDAAESLASALGPDVRFVEGVVLGDDSAGLALSVRRTETRQGVASRWNGERFTFPHDSYGALAERRLSVPGSLLFGGALLGGVVAIRTAFGNGTNHSVGGGIPSGTQ